MDCKQIDLEISEVSKKMITALDQDDIPMYWDLYKQRLELMKKYNEQLKIELRSWPKSVIKSCL